jgi:hypothetical protein
MSIGSTAHMDLPSDCFSDGFLLEASWSSHHPREDTLISASVNPRIEYNLCAAAVSLSVILLASLERLLLSILVLGELGRLDRCTHYLHVTSGPWKCFR